MLCAKRHKKDVTALKQVPSAYAIMSMAAMKRSVCELITQHGSHNSLSR